jgi:phosphohistidine swiveling domain-containing protein
VASPGAATTTNGRTPVPGGAGARVVPLRAAAELGLELVGGKALGLGRLLRAGLPVPDGVVVTAEAWSEAVQALGLDSPPTGDREAALASGRELAARLLACPFPARLTSELAAALAALGAGPLAVRSSAQDEDQRDASAAGVFTTLLDVRGRAALEDAVRACWASAFSDAAVTYRLDRARPLLPMAVVVQRQVASRAAGVAFTAPGEQGRRTLVEAVAGRGEELVAGRVDPTRYELPLADEVESLGGEVPPPLDRGGLLSLEALCRRIDAALLGPDETGGVDIEWAQDAHHVLHVLQARPVTRAARAGGAARVRWTAANTQEALLDPVTPLTWSLLAPLVEAGRADLFRAAGLAEVPGPGYMRLFHGRPYFNPDYFRAFLRQIPGAPEGIFDALIFGEKAGPIEIALPRLSLAPPLGRLCARLLPAVFAPPAAPGSGPRGASSGRDGRTTVRLLLMLLAARLLARERFELFLRLTAWRLRRLDATPLDRLDDRALVERWRAATGLTEAALRRHVLGTAISGAAYLLLEMLLARTGASAIGGGKLVAHLTAGAPGSALGDASARLFRLAAQAAGKPTLRRALSDPAPPRDLAALDALGPEGRWLGIELRRLLERAGHRCEKEAELLEPRWRDDPAVLLAVLGGQVRAATDHAAGPDLAERESRLGRRARALAARVTRHLAKGSRLERLLPVRRLAFRALLREARRYAPYRENLKDAGLRALHRVRAAFLEAGARLAARGRLDRPEDVFFLEVAEVESTLLFPNADDLRPRVAARKAEREADLLRPPPRVVVEVPGFPPRPLASVEAGAGLVEGVGVSGGRATGRARILRGPEEAARLGPGDIIVARVVNAGWTPLFHLAGGVVAEVGGVLSHAAIVAREYGLPAVFGAAGATRIEDGARIVVDGDLGIVTVEGPATT